MRKGGQPPKSEVQEKSEKARSPYCATGASCLQRIWAMTCSKCGCSKDEFGDER